MSFAGKVVEMAAIHILGDKSEGGVFGLDVRANTENVKFPRELLKPDSVEDVVELFVKILHLKGVHDPRYARLLLTKEALHAKILFQYGATVHPDVLPIFDKATKCIASTMRLLPQHREVLKAQLEALQAESSARGRKSTKSSGGGGARGKSRERSEDSEEGDRSSLASKIEAMLASGSSEKDIASLLEKAVGGRTGSMSSTASADTRMFMLLSPALSKPQSTAKLVAIEEGMNAESRKVLREMKEANKIITSLIEQYIEQASAHSMAIREVLSRYQEYKRGNSPDVDVKFGDEFLSAVNVKLSVPYMFALLDKYLSAQNRVKNYDRLQHLNKNHFEFKVMPVESLHLDPERQFVVRRRSPSISEVKEKLKDARANLAVAQGLHVDEAVRVASDKQLVSLLRRALSETKDNFPRLHVAYLGAEKIVQNKRIEAAAAAADDDDKDVLGATDGREDFEENLKLKDYVSYTTACFDENPHIEDTVKVAKSKPKKAEEVDTEFDGELTFGAVESEDKGSAERLKGEKKPCFYFKNGTCTYGDKCRFYHDVDAAPAKVVNAGKGGKGKRDKAEKPEQQKPQFQGGKGGKGGKGKVVEKESNVPKSLVAKENNNASKGGGGMYKTYEKGCFICGDLNHLWGDDKFHNDTERKARLDMLKRQYKQKSNGAAAADANNSDE